METSTITRAAQLCRFDEIEPDPAWSFDWVKPSETSKWTHGYHRYAAKFIPQLVEKLFDEYLDGSSCHVNDPFMGSGTTIVSAVSRGHYASGTDVNAIACLMTRVKARPIDPVALEGHTESLYSRIGYLDIGEDSLLVDQTVPLIPERHLERIDYWFYPETKVLLGKLLRQINEEEDLVIREFFLVAFSHILKNCSIWMQGSTKPTRAKNKRVSPPLKTFNRHLCKMLRGNAAFWKSVPAEVREDPGSFLKLRRGDSRHQPVEDNTIGLVVSSSPYVTSYEYADLHQLSTIWLDLSDDLNGYKKEFIGTARKQYQSTNIASALGQKTVSRMSEISPSMSRQIEAFFADMQSVFHEMHRILKPGSRCCFVIGNTKLRGVPILNAEVFAELMASASIPVERVIKREIPSKILPQHRDEKTGRFATKRSADSQAYPVEYILVGKKEG